MIGNKGRDGARGFVQTRILREGPTVALRLGILCQISLLWLGSCFVTGVTAWAAHGAKRKSVAPPSLPSVVRRTQVAPPAIQSKTQSPPQRIAVPTPIITSKPKAPEAAAPRIKATGGDKGAAEARAKSQKARADRMAERNNELKAREVAARRARNTADAPDVPKKRRSSGSDRRPSPPQISARPPAEAPAPSPATKPAARPAAPDAGLAQYVAPKGRTPKRQRGEEGARAKNDTKNNDDDGAAPVGKSGIGLTGRDSMNGRDLKQRELKRSNPSRDEASGEGASPSAKKAKPAPFWEKTEDMPVPAPPVITNWSAATRSRSNPSSGNINTGSTSQVGGAAAAAPGGGMMGGGMGGMNPMMMMMMMAPHAAPAAAPVVAPTPTPTAAPPAAALGENKVAPSNTSLLVAPGSPARSGYSEERGGFEPPAHSEGHGGGAAEGHE